MATSGSGILIPPDFDEKKWTWREYKKEVEVWASLTNLCKPKQGPALWMALKGKAKEAVKEMEISEIKSENGLSIMLEKLDALFKTDDNQAAYLAYRDFESFVRPSEMSFQDFVVQFESLNSRIKRHKMVLPDGVLAYRFLHSANLREDEMKLCRATIREFTYAEMKNKVMSMCGDRVQSVIKEAVVKTEPVFYGENQSYGNKSNNETYSRGRRNWNRGGQRRGGEQSKSRGGREYVTPQKPMNPIGPNGIVSKCAVCGSKYHWVKSCPEISHERDGSNKVGFVKNEDSDGDSESGDVKISLFQDTSNDNASLQWFLGETLGCAVIDSGCSKTVAGSNWFKCFLEMLDDKELEQITRKDSDQSFKFGKGDSIQSKGKIVIPVTLGKKRISIESDIVEADIPLLLSKEALKKAETVLDFNNDTAVMFGEKQTLIPTQSGHYAIPLSVAKDEKSIDQQIVLISNSIYEEKGSTPYKIALKLHRQFCHCRAEKLVKLIKMSKLWTEEEEKVLAKEVKTISENCNICKRYKKSPSVPIVSVPLASSFNDVVAMDLIMIEGRYILHLIDLFTRYSVACVRNSKRQDVIVDGIMKIWISYFGKPRKFLADNGGEFANESYTDMCTSLDIELMKTAAESPWSNGICERHNGVLKESILKTLEETNCSLESATAWSTSAKNTLSNQFGYSSNILVFGKNPSFPSVVSDKLPALTSDNLAITVEENLSSMRAARKAFIESESSERIKRALSHNVRSNTEINYERGDKVFYKRNDTKRWYGPGVVLGQDGKQVIVKNGGETVRVHVSRLVHVGKESFDRDENITNEQVDEAEDSRLINIENISLTDHDVEFQNNRLTTMENIPSIRQENVDITNDFEVKSGLPSVEKQVSLECEQSLDHQEEEDKNQNVEHLIQINQEKTENVVKIPVLPKVKSDIAYKLVTDQTDEDWKQGQVYSRAGKVGGRNESCFNIKDKSDSKIRWYDFKKDIKEWHPIPSNVLITNSDKNTTLTAKQKEIENWKRNDVYEEVAYDNQHLVSTRWVLTTKEMDSVMITKARLVARGFEDNLEIGKKFDSPTCSRETLSLTLCLLAMKGWKCSAIDIKTAFLQGKPLERDVFLKPPREFNTGSVWKLKKAVYGLNEASRSWYERVKEEFLKVGLCNSKYDEALFYQKENDVLLGVIAIHVDDFIYGGYDEFENNIIKRVRSVFEVGTETSTPMKFLGMNVDQDDNYEITFNQNDYLSDINIKESIIKGDKRRDLSAEEQRDFRGIVGQLNWITSRTNPIISFDVCQLSTKLSQATVGDFHYARKVIQQAIKPVTLNFVNLQAPVYLLAYCDASFANLPDGSSQGGYIIFLADAKRNVSPIAWCSKKLQRVCRSSLAAEVMAIVETIDMCVWLRYMISEVFDEEILTTIVRTDNKSSYDNINSTTPADEKRTRVDIAAIRQSVRRKEISLEWIRKENQLADVLTKQGADSTKLLSVLKSGRI